MELNAPLMQQLAQLKTGLGRDAVDRDDRIFLQVIPTDVTVAVGPGGHIRLMGNSLKGGKNKSCRTCGGNSVVRGMLGRQIAAIEDKFALAVRVFGIEGSIVHQFCGNAAFGGRGAVFRYIERTKICVRDHFLHRFHDLQRTAACQIPCLRHDKIK